MIKKFFLIFIVLILSSSDYSPLYSSKNNKIGETILLILMSLNGKNFNEFHPFFLQTVISTGLCCCLATVIVDSNASANI